ncbi:MAG: hypothetical protein IJM48_00325, partial [Treponema sp.]|nr:hypothetical protein [Treponema sp.]
MIFALINFALALFMTWLAIFLDSKTGNEGKNPVISLNVFLALSCAGMGLTIFAAHGAPARLILFFAEVTLFLFGLYSLYFSVYCIFYPASERKVLAQILLVGGAIWCAWAVFFHITGVTVTNFVGLRIDSMSLFDGGLATMLPYNWFTFYCIIIFLVVPFFSMLVMLLRSENREGKLDHQKSILNALALIAAWGSVILIGKASKRVPMFSSLILIPYVLAQWILVRSTLVDFLYDFLSLVGFAVKSVICYILPALFAG